MSNNDKFFKIKLEKLLQKIPMVNQLELKLNESQWGMIEGLENNRFWVHISARRTGKSYAAAILAFAKLLEPGTQVMVVAPNFSLSSIIWDYTTQIIRDLALETERFNQKDKVIRLVNGSTFRLLSANNRDSLIGRAANLLIVDEAAIIPNDEYFTRDLRPALSTFPDSRCLWISTPRGKGNYLYEYYLRGQDPEFDNWGSARFTWRANPLLNQIDIDEARKSMSKNLFGQEYECDWVTLEGKIFNIDENKHLRQIEEINPGDYRYEFLGGLDIGYRDETAFVVLAKDSEENFYVVDEYVAKEGTTSTHAIYIKEIAEKWDIDTIYIDSAAQQTKADLAYDYDIYCENAQKSVNDGILAIQNLVDNDKLVFDIDNARHSFDSMAAYRWNERTEKQKPVHDWTSHCCDAIRYAIYSNLRGQVSIYA